MDYYDPLELKLVDFMLHHNVPELIDEHERPLPVSATTLPYNLASSAAKRPISGKPSKNSLPKIPKVSGRSISQSSHQSRNTSHSTATPHQALQRNAALKEKNLKPTQNLPKPTKGQPSQVTTPTCTATPSHASQRMVAE
jgi:hypothetical protein